MHSIDIGVATIVQDEMYENGTVTLRPPVIVSFIPEDPAMTAAEARSAAADFLAAAERLEQITA